MKLLFIFGNAAVGKMTVGQEIMKRTGMRLFHNHMTIEPVIEIFGTYKSSVVTKIRETVFEEFATGDYYGVIFTYMFAFDRKEDWDYVGHVTEMFESHGAEVYYSELVASQEVRLGRNRTENRLQNKPSKRDIELSDTRLIRDDKKYRLVSNDGEIPFENYIKIDNTNLSPQETAQIIIDRFGL